ncbi:ankyrin repeat domain-containing protein 33B-like [Lampetra planeri]
MATCVTRGKCCTRAKGGRGSVDCRTAILNACESNNCVALRWLLGQGATWGDVNATDANGRTGLAVASCCGFAGVVSVLLQCPLVDVQVPDNEGNTALMLAVQAGNVPPRVQDPPRGADGQMTSWSGDVGITRQLLCVEEVVARGALEVPNALGLSALMQAAVQGRLQCARQLVLAGADMEVRDSGRGLRAQEWALLGGRADTAALLERLAKRRRPEWLQRDGYRLGSPCLGDDDHASSAGQGAAGRFLRALRALTDACFPGGPQDNGALDHMVRATTAVSGPFVGTACKPCFGETTRDSGATVEAPPSAATMRGGDPKVTGLRAGAPPYLRGASRGRGRVARATGWWMLTRPWRLRVGVRPESPLPSIRLSKVGRVTPAPEEGAQSPRGLQSAQLLCVPGP